MIREDQDLPSPATITVAEAITNNHMEAETHMHKGVVGTMMIETAIEALAAKEWITTQAAVGAPQVHLITEIATEISIVPVIKGPIQASQRDSEVPRVTERDLTGRTTMVLPRLRPVVVRDRAHTNRAHQKDLVLARSA